MTPKRTFTRRNFLRGAGVTLALPWLESLAPRPARGQTLPATTRFVATYFPMGTAAFWTPASTGAGNAWKLSPILEPLAPLKSKVTVLSHVNNTAYGAAHVSPAYPRDSAGFLTSAAAQLSPPLNGISVDQVIAQFGAAPAVPSVQLGLSTLDSYTEDLPPAFSRSISWSSPSNPLFKIVSPQNAFDALLAGGVPQMAPDLAAEARRATRKSVLDFVREDATAIQPRLSYSDRTRLEQFMTSVRDLEQRVALAPKQPMTCNLLPRPTATFGTGSVPADYNRDTHATMMIDLIVMALSCNLTRVVSFMLDDARSDFVYNFLQQRAFSATGSTPGTAPVGGYRGLAQGAGRANDGYATINWWFVSKLADLGQKLAALADGAGASVLDNTVIWFGSGMNNGVDQSFSDLPVLYLGSGGGVLKTDAHIDFATGCRLSDVYLTFLQKVFGLPNAKFADSAGIVPDILA